MNPTRSSKTPVQQPPRSNSPPVVGFEAVAGSCGHLEPLPLHAPRADRFRNERRAKVASRPCRACRQAERLAQEEAARARRAAGLHPRQVAYSMHGRLPDGAQFEAVYNAATETWSGTLTIDGRAFAAEASAVHHLLRVLDRQYRQSLRAQAPEPAPLDRGQE